MENPENALELLFMSIPDLKFDDNGLIPAIVQDVRSGDVLMLAYMNNESLEKTLATGRTWFYSRSRQELWRKGDTSGNVQMVREVRYDCDEDAILLLVDQVGNACHTEERSCFYRKIGDADNRSMAQIGTPASFLHELFDLIEERKVAAPDGSYTASLFKEGLDKILAKFKEEFLETYEAAEGGNTDEIVWEAADLLYHLFVLLSNESVSLTEVEAELKRRRK